MAGSEKDTVGCGSIRTGIRAWIQYKRLRGERIESRACPTRATRPGQLDPLFAFAALPEEAAVNHDPFRAALAATNESRVALSVG